MYGRGANKSCGLRPPQDVAFLALGVNGRICLATPPFVPTKNEMLMSFRIPDEAVNVLPVCFSQAVLFVLQFRGPCEMDTSLV